MSSLSYRWPIVAICLARVSAGSTNTSTSSAAGTASSAAASLDNVLFANYVLSTLASLVFAIAAYHIILGGFRHLRTMTCLNNNTQMYFRMPSGWAGTIKQHLLYAPLFQTRHMRELRLFRRCNVGILPTRLQTIFLLGVVGMNIALCVTGIEWSQAGTQTMMTHLRNRTGTLAAVNLIPLVIMGGRNNPMIKMLNISFDTFNLVHRWFGRIVVAESVAHTIVWAVKEVETCTHARPSPVYMLI